MLLKHRDWNWNREGSRNDAMYSTKVKVCGQYVVTEHSSQLGDLYLSCIRQSFAVKNRHQKDAYYDEIGRCA